jgi:hypothetical protein
MITLLMMMGGVNLEEVGYLTPADVDQLIASATRPDDTMPVTLYGVPQVGNLCAVDFVMTFPGQTLIIPNNGHPVPLRAVMDLKLLVFWLKHHRRISCIPERAWGNHTTF